MTEGYVHKNDLQRKHRVNSTKAGAAYAKEKHTTNKEKVRDKTNPPGGKDDTPIPPASNGYTVQFTFHRAENLPISDFKTRSSDPYIIATLTSPGIRKRHREDPDLAIRTRTIHRSTNPEWNQHWVVANIPSGGFRLKCRLYDEDAKDCDDRLGNVTVSADDIAESWSGIREQVYDIKKRMGSKRAYLLKGCMSTFSRKIHMNGKLFLSVEVLGKSNPPYGRMYTVGPIVWTKHYSSVIGRLAGTKNLEEDKSREGKIERYDYNNKTEHGTVEPRSQEASKKFLEMAHYDEGGRIFTYVITLDGLVRFTETGKELGIDLLSKHTMHSDLNIYVAFSGEFFVRRLAKPDKPATAPDQETHPAEDIPGGPPNEPAPKDPKSYELVIDNDSGTYRPKGDLLGDLKKFLNYNFPGLHVTVKECTDKKLNNMKDEQRKIRKTQGQTVDWLPNDDDDEALDRHTRGQHRLMKQRAYRVLEDPRSTLKEAISGEKGRIGRE